MVFFTGQRYGRSQHQNLSLGALIVRQLQRRLHADDNQLWVFFTQLGGGGAGGGVAGDDQRLYTLIEQLLGDAIRAGAHLLLAFGAVGGIGDIAIIYEALARKQAQRCAQYA